MVLLGVLLPQGWEDRHPEGGRASASYEGACPQDTQAQAMLGRSALSVTCSLLQQCTRRPRRGGLRSRAGAKGGKEGALRLARRGCFPEGARPGAGCRGEQRRGPRRGLSPSPGRGRRRPASHSLR